MSAPHDFSDTVAAYVLGALEPSEAEAFRAHLESCPVCQDEVESLGGVVQALGMAAPQRAASPALRRRVLRQARSEAKSGAPRRRWRPLAPPRWGVRAALATTAILAVVVVAVVLGQSAGPASRVIQARVAGIAGTAQLRITGDRGELIVHRLSPPPPGHVYEVWLKRPRGAPAPAGVLFSVTASGSADLGLPAGLHGVGQVLVTPEPDGGSPAPTHTPVIIAQLS